MSGAADLPPDGSDLLGPDSAGVGADALHQQLSVLAHDFNNELLGILGNVGLARLDVPADSPARESLDDIEEAAARSSALVRRLLAVLRPTDEPAETPLPSPPSAVGISPSGTEPWAGRTVLIVDDELLIRTVVTRMLAQLGVKARSCATAADALAALAADGGGVDLVILDLALPDQSGETVLAELVRRRVPVRVLLSSGFTDQWNDQRARALGAAGFLGKPFTRPMLEAALGSALAGPA